MDRYMDGDYVKVTMLVEVEGGGKTKKEYQDKIIKKESITYLKSYPETPLINLLGKTVLHVKRIQDPNEIQNIEEVYDSYASAALGALIAKIPLMDRDGEFSKEIDQEELNEIKIEISKSAHAYAMFMIETRAEFIDYLKEKYN